MNDFIEDNSFLIVGKPQETYKGFYKDGKPFQGYFLKGNHEFPRVDYYEDGEAKFQYSLDFFQMALNEENVERDYPEEPDPEITDSLAYDDNYSDRYKPKLNIKSVYKNGKIADGYEYDEIESGLLSLRIEDTKITEFHMDIFAMNYYQRNSIILKSDTIVITSPTLALTEDNPESKIFRKNGEWVVSYTLNEKKIGYKYFRRGELDQKPASGVFFVFEQSGKTYSYGTSIPVEHASDIESSDMLTYVLDQPKLFALEEISLFFESFVHAIISKIKKSEQRLPDSSNIYRAYLEIGSDHTITKGIRFFEEKQGSYYIQYQDGKETLRKKLDLSEFQKIFSNYLNGL